MNSIFEKNIDIIKNRDKFLYDKYVEKYKDNDEVNDVVLECTKLQAKNGEDILIINKEQKNYRMNSAYNPSEEAKIWAEQYKSKTIERVVSIFGLGNGLFIRSLIKQLDESTRFIITEPSEEVFRFIINNFDISDILDNERVYLIVNNINEVSRASVYGSLVAWIQAENHIGCVLTYYDNVFNNEYKEFIRNILKSKESATTNKNTISYFSNRLVKNTFSWFRNMENEMYLDEFAKSIPEDITGIIVAAGPSLEKNIEELKRAKGKSIIICVNTALAFMAKKNIEPDFGIIIDPVVKRLQFESEMSKRVPLMHDITASDEAVRENYGKKFTIATQNYKYMSELLIRIGQSNGVYVAGGSVATAAFSILLRLGVKRIVLVGQDLAYSEDGGTHAFGHRDGSDTCREMIDGINGDKVETRFDWKSYLRWFENSIKVVNEQDVEVIDATEGGALIHGTKIMKLSEVVDKYCKQDFNSKEIIDSMQPNEDIILKLKECINDDINDLQQIKIKLPKAIESANRLISACEKNTIHKKCYNKDIEIMKKTNKFCEQKPVYKLLEFIDDKEANEVLEGIYTFTDNEMENMKNTYKKSLEMYEILLKAANTALELFAELPNI